MMQKHGIGGVATGPSQSEPSESEWRRRLDSALHLVGATLSQQDRDLRYEWVENPDGDFPPRDIVGLTDEEILPSRLAAQLGAAKRDVMATGETRRIEVGGPEGPGIWYEIAIEPVRDAGGAVSGVRTTALDISARKNSEEHLRVLLLELAHRSKNLLAVIQAIANRTAQDSSTIETFTKRFLGRLQALAQAHDLLTERDWHGAALQTLVRSQVLIPAGRSANRIHAVGDELYLRPGAAQHVSLALHELASNALSHGALSSPSGRVIVEWARHARPDADGLRGATFTWSERDGPPVRPPERRQFGRVLLEDIVPLAVGGRAELSFLPEGMIYRLEIGGRELG